MLENKSQKTESIIVLITIYLKMFLIARYKLLNLNKLKILKLNIKINEDHKINLKINLNMVTDQTNEKL